jgi:hypothetical protein
MNYKHSSELKGKILEYRDIVHICNMYYRTEVDFLENIGDSDENSAIFPILGIPDKNLFCKRYYGYLPYNGNFPSSKDKDYASLTKVAIALMGIAEIRTVADALAECECVKTQIKNWAIIRAAKELKNSIKNKKPDYLLNENELKKARQLFILAEQKIHKNKWFHWFL